MAKVSDGKNIVDNRAFGGCGIMMESKYKLTTYGQDQTVTANRNCDKWVTNWPAEVKANTPNAVLLTTSFWDANAQVIDGTGTFQKITDKKFHDQYVSKMRKAISLLTGTGARVYLDDSLPYLGSDMPSAEAMRTTVVHDIYEPAKKAGLNVALLPLHAQMCTDTDCPSTIDGVRVLDDTGHPAGKSLSRLSTWMLNYIATDLKSNAR